MSMLGEVHAVAESRNLDVTVHYAANAQGWRHWSAVLARAGVPAFAVHGHAEPDEALAELLAVVAERGEGQDRDAA